MLFVRRMMIEACDPKVSPHMIQYSRVFWAHSFIFLCCIDRHRIYLQNFARLLGCGVFLWNHRLPLKSNRFAGPCVWIVLVWVLKARANPGGFKLKVEGGSVYGRQDSYSWANDCRFGGASSNVSSPNCRHRMRILQDAKLLLLNHCLYDCPLSAIRISLFTLLLSMDFVALYVPDVQSCSEF